MITRFPDCGHQAPWVAGDEVYGGNPTLRAALEDRATGYVLAVAGTHGLAGLYEHLLRLRPGPDDLIPLTCNEI